jgi:polar amino acid transport system ATP-binding protein
MKLELRGISKRFGAQQVLDDISLTAEGHALVLVGPSGGGKSTLLRVMAGLEAPDAGSVVIDGEPVPGDEASLLVFRRTIGVVFQSFNLFPHLSALANITLPMIAVHGLGEGEAHERAYALLDRFQLADHAHKKPAQLSGGQRQRVAIVRAVSMKPRLLLFDEPTSALDPEMTGEVLDMIAELRSEGRDLILVTHHLAFARRVADHAVFLAGGKILENGPTEALFTHPSTEPCRRFLERVLRY